MKCFFASYLKNILYREPSFILKYYLCNRKYKDVSYEYVFMVDSKILNGGLFDRLKGAVSIYAISKVKGKKFGIFFKEPFELEKYLTPVSYDWTMVDDDVIYSYPVSRPVIAYSEFRNPRRLFKSRQGQTHFYFGNDILEMINKKHGTSFRWNSLYRELFTPSNYLRDYVRNIQRHIGQDYMAIHLRFLNLLGDKVEVNRCQVLNDNDRKTLIDSCLKKINELIQASPQWRPLLSSDSMVFLDEVKKKFSSVYIVPGQVRHLDATNITSEDENLKLFSDVYLIAGALKVYSICGKGLYKSAFPEYSAKIGERPFERIYL